MTAGAAGELVVTSCKPLLDDGATAAIILPLGPTDTLSIPCVLVIDDDEEEDESLAAIILLQLLLLQST